MQRGEIDQWMSHRMLPENLRARIRRYEQYKWQEKRGIQEESLISNFPKDLRRDIKRHLCWTLFTR
ncbi:UNVERIFIED_CONTAM: putative cyclic nucleotide-gated ion channel 13, partial [Sesamum radiatum]